MHYYTHNGTPAHFEAKGGKPTTLREARKLNLLPSVTTVLGIKDKPALTAWKQRQTALKALTMPTDSPDDEWAASVVRAARDDVLTKAQEGTDIHDILERAAVDTKWERSPDLLLIEAVDECVRQNTGHGIVLFTPEATLTDEALGYAGKCDLHGNGWVIDYKTKDVVGEKERGYPEQAEQLAAYAHALGMPNARLANVFIQRTPNDDGTWNVAWFEHKDPLAFERFRLALQLWQISKKFGPYFDAFSDELEAA